MRFVQHQPRHVGRGCHPKPYLDRNRDIVDACEVLLATPDGPERLRSGTWSTVRYARKIGKPVEVRLP